jgi:hypothetical protein
LAFDLVDVADPADIPVVGKIFNLVAPLGLEGLLNAHGPSGAFIEPASRILELFGKDYLRRSANNQRLWSFANPVIFSVGSTYGEVKLRRGVYFIGGLARKTRTFPPWGDYQLRAADPNNSGPKVYLYRKADASGKLARSDFTYAILSIDYATPLY